MARSTRSSIARLVRHGELLPLAAIAAVALMMVWGDESSAPARVAVTVSAAELSTSPVLVAYEALRSESVFVGPRVGFAAEPSRESRHFRVLLADRDAAELFGRLWYEASTPAAQLYALAGLYLVDRPSFRRLSPILAGSHERVPTFIGCIYSHVSMAEMVDELTTGGLARGYLPDSNTVREDRLLDSLELAAKLRSSTAR